MEREQVQIVDWFAFLNVYEKDILIYVKKCPFHLFDTKRKKNITHFELKVHMYLALSTWVQIPLSGSELVRCIWDVSTGSLDYDTVDYALYAKWSYDILPYIYSALTKAPITDGVYDFIYTLGDELKAFRQSPFIQEYYYPTLSMEDITPAVRELIEWKRTRSSMPTRENVQEVIEYIGQYAILSHCWQEEELSFTDVANFTDPTVQAKKGFRKLQNFSGAVERLYRCRFLWTDTVCIDETERAQSIPRMFGWYRHAYVCIIYLAAHPPNSVSPWFARGWTLQEFLAARRIRVLTGDNWEPMSQQFDACRDNPVRDTSSIIKSIANSLKWWDYKPGLESTIPLFYAMCQRETTRPEDRVYCLLSALGIYLSIQYGEGFDRAFARLQAYYLTHSRNRDLLFWDVTFAADRSKSCSSPWNSMLVADFETFRDCYIGLHEACISNKLPDSSIKFYRNGMMRIMVSLFSQESLHHPRTLTLEVEPGNEPVLVFASFHVVGSGKPLESESGSSYYYGVWLRPTTVKNRSGDTYGERGKIEGDGRVVYERVSFQRVKTSDLPFHDLQKPEWVYIK